MRDLNELYYFVRVVDNGGFAAAARATNMQKSMLSRRILQLENRLGVRLVNRSTRQFSVTDAGREYYERCVAMLAEAEAADQVVAELRAEPKGLVRVSCPVALMHYGFGPLFARFLAGHAGVNILLESANRDVDVIAEGFDLAIRAHVPPLAATDLVMRKLDTITLRLVGAPAIVEGRSLDSPGDLAGLPSIALGPSRRNYSWFLELPSGQSAKIGFSPRLISDDMVALRDAAIAGVGIVQLPEMVVRQEIEAGRLVHVLPHWESQKIIVHAILPSRRGVMPSVRALLDFLVEESAANRIIAGRRAITIADVGAT